MTQPYAPPRPPGPGGRVATAVITALAVVGVILVLTLTDTEAAPSAQGGGYTGGSVTGGANASDGSNGVPGSSGTGGSDSSGTVPSTAELEAKFPFPPGTTRIPTPASEKYGTPGTKYYAVRGTLDSVRSFLVSELAGLGVKLLSPATVSVGGKIDGYFYNYASTELMLDIHLSTDTNAGVRAGTVRIEVKFGV